MTARPTSVERLLTPQDMADFFGVSVEKFMEWRRVNAWPYVKVGRTFRFTQAHVDEIVARHTEQPAADKRLPAGGPGQPALVLSGQTKRSAARAS